jgi:hypothetical protein
MQNLKFKLSSWSADFSWPLLIVAIFFISPTLIIAWISFSRQDFFQQHLENMGEASYSLLVLAFCLYLLGYLLVAVIKPSANNSWLWLVAVLTFVVGLVIIPLLSRDTTAYALNADVFYHGHLNPYLTPIGLGRQSWHLGQLWWLTYPSPYGPVFLLLLGWPFLASFGQLIPFIYSYKVLVLLAFILTGYLFSSYRRQCHLPAYLDWLFYLNPALIVNWLIEGHQEVFIVLMLLWLLWRSSKKNVFNLGALLLVSFIKITAVIIWPLSWFKDKIFNWRRFWQANLLLLLSWLLFFAIIHLTPLDFWHNNLAFLNQQCFYACSPLVMVSNNLLGGAAGLIRLGLFIVAYLASLYFFLFKNYQPVKFIIWSFTALFFVNTNWLTPWYPTLIIPFSLLTKQRSYIYLAGIITAYCLWHYLGL